MMTRFRLILPLCAALLATAPAVLAATEGDPRLQNAQQILQMLGLQPGALDGRPNARTAAALAEFQKRAGLPATGKLDDGTLDALRATRDQKFTRSLSTAPGAAERRAPAAPEGKLRGLGAQPDVATEQLSGPNAAAPPGDVAGEALPGSVAAPTRGGFDRSYVTLGAAPVIVILMWLVWRGARRDERSDDLVDHTVAERREPLLEAAARQPGAPRLDGPGERIRLD